MCYQGEPCQAPNPRKDPAMIPKPMRSITPALLTLLVLGWGAQPLPVSAQPARDIFQAVLPETDLASPQISTAQLGQILAAKSAVVFDARPRLEYAMSHIPGALNLAPKPGVSKALYVSDVAEVQRVQPDKSAPVVLYCNGPFCGKAKRLAKEMVQAGYTNVMRYQLGMPVWRALGGLTQMEPQALALVLAKDQTAVLLDARDPAEFQAGTLGQARNLPASQLKEGKDQGVLKAAKDDGRLPVEDHNTRIVVFGRDSAQAQAVAQALTQEAFHNVAFFGGTFEDLTKALNR